MATESQPDPEYVKALEQQIQRIERENRRLKREVLTLSPSKTTNKDGSPKPTRDWKPNETSAVSVQLEDLDIDLDEVLEGECEDSWIYKSPIRPSGDDSGLTPEQWLLQGLDDGAVTKNRDELIDVRRDLSTLLLSTPHNDTGIVDDRGSSLSASLDSSNSHVSASGASTFTLSPSQSYLLTNEITPTALSVSPEPLQARHASQGSSPVLRPGSDSRANIRTTPSPSPRNDSPTGDEPPAAAATAAAATADNGSRRSLVSAGATRPAMAKAAPQRRSSGTTSSAGGGGLAQPRAAVPLATATAAPTAKPAAGSRLSMTGSRMSKPASSGSGLPAPAASGLRQPSSAASKPRASSGLPTASRPASQLPRPGQAPPARSGLKAPRKVTGSSAGEPKGKDWSEGCY